MISVRSPGASVREYFENSGPAMMEFVSDADAEPENQKPMLSRLMIRILVVDICARYNGSGARDSKLGR